MSHLSKLILRPLIGVTAKVVHSKNPSLHRINGQIIEDTHSMLTLFDGLRHRQIPKASSTFELRMPNGTLAQIQGKALLGHPAERLRRAKKLRW